MDERGSKSWNGIQSGIALLKGTTDPRSVAALEQLIKKTMNRLDQIDEG
jgi:hypothetical protein